VVQQVKASDGSSVTLYLFTTLSLPVEQLLQLYGQRWNVETDLRSLAKLRTRSVCMFSNDVDGGKETHAHSLNPQ